jgi:hypothetical protein
VLAAEEGPGLIRNLMRNIDEIGLPLKGAMPLVSVAESLARHLGAEPMPPATDEGLEELFRILKQKREARLGVRNEIKQYCDYV